MYLSNVNSNPFDGDDEYDESKNPFFDNDDLDINDDYDRAKNPFAE